MEEARAGAETLFNQYLANPWEMLLPPGYMSLESMKRTMAMRRKSLGAQQALTIEDMAANGVVIVGSPQTVRDRIARMKERTGFGILVCLLQFGIMPDDLAKRNMEMFTAEVMPWFRGAAKD
jgi:alkanesulfonate monooxygenase SsuD/methylene tetrahydromethanopterin reductase-like flavin-dependent oxidoreductase (luciferase family)